MIRRLFPSDKNYILTEVQTAQRKYLLKFLVQHVKKFYLQNYNPLGLIDNTILEIQKEKKFPLHAFDEFYHDLAAIYRFQYGEVQLELLFDGTTHFEKYTLEWITYFKESVYSFCSNRFFIRAVLDIAVFHHHDRVAFLAGDRLKYYLINFFNLKVYKYRGLMELAS